MPTNDYLPYLQHHGILGMKWGVRRYQNEDGSLTSAGRRRYSDSNTRKEEKDRKKHPEKYMDNKELREALNRMNMERQYKNLSGDSSFKKGLKTAAKVLEVAGTVTVATAAAFEIADMIRNPNPQVTKLRRTSNMLRTARGAQQSGSNLLRLL
jgi:hypothetical protein